MIELKRCNYFTGEMVHVASGVSRIVKFLEDDGFNYLLIVNVDKSSGLKYLLSNSLLYNDFDEFSVIINNKSNLFRVNLLIFDFWHLPYNDIIDYKKEIDKLDINYIIIAKEYHYKINDDVNDFLIRIEYKNYTTSDIWITDNITKSCSNLESMKTSFIRDKKIDILFDKKNDCR